MSDNYSICYLHLVLEEIKYHKSCIYEMIKEFVYIEALLQWDRQIVYSEHFNDVSSLKICKKIDEMEYGPNFIPIYKSYRTRTFLNLTLTNFDSFKISHLSEIDFKYTSLTKLPDRLFKHSLCRKVILPQNLKKIPLECFYKSKICEVIINNKCECIETNAFSYCIQLVMIIIPENVEKIKFKAFYNSSLLKVIFTHKEKSTITFYKDSFIMSSLRKINFTFINKSVNVNYKSSKIKCLGWK